MSSKNILKGQKKLFFILLCGIFFIALGLSYFLFDDTNSPVSDPPSVDLPGDRIAPQEIWMTKLEAENKLIEKKLSYIEELLLERVKKEDREMVELRREISVVKEKASSVKPALKEEKPFSPFEPAKPIPRLPLSEVWAEGTKDRVLHVDRVIPAGTTVRAIIVSSVDAPCSVYSAADPQPVKLRILDDGHLPKNVTAQLKGGLLIGSVYGDLSSERIYIRIERLTQVKANGDFVETVVTGFVSGEDGKYGVRGTVIDKSGKMIGNAAVSGFFSGVSHSIGKARMDPQLAVFGVAKEGAVAGTSQAFDRITDYFIKRAEQIRPVIQVTAGRIVDITFTHKAELGDLYTQDKVKQIRETSRERRD